MAPRPDPAVNVAPVNTPSYDLEIPSPRSVLASSPEQVVILVDPLSSGVLLQRRVFEAANYSVVVVWSDRSQPGAREKHFKRSGYSREDFLAVITHEEGMLDETLSAILAATINKSIVAVMCGSEHGVLLEDQLATELNRKLGTDHLKGSGMPVVTTKVDKHAQANTIRAAGLEAVREKLAFTGEDVMEFLKENEGSSIVVKPQTGAGSVGVTFCDTPEAVMEAFRGILAGQHKAKYGDVYRHYTHAGVLLQEYLKGTEYIVDSVVRDGVPKTTAIWKYDKRPYNGAAFVCFSKELQVVSDPNCEEILEYAEKVLKAVGFKNGAIHAEIMFTARGPVLVELNCRLHGGSAAWARPAEICMGYHQLSILMDINLNCGKMFETIGNRPAVPRSYAYQVKMRSHIEGTLDHVITSQLDRIKALPSYLEHFFTVHPGDQLLKTRDLPSTPGEITLVHEDRLVLAEDYRKLNEILAEGIFETR